MTTQPGTPLSTLNPAGILYPFAEVFEVETNGDTAVDVWKIPKGTIITMLLAKIKVLGTASSGRNLFVGDVADPNGYLLNAALCGTAVDVIYGDAVSERGAYLKNTEETSIMTHAGSWKVYKTGDKKVILDVDGAMIIEATLEIFIFGYRYNEI